jgi:hypothetical protein
MSRHLRMMIAFAYFAAGVVQHLLTGRNSNRQHLGLIQLFCLTGGRFNDWWNGVIGRGARPLTLSSKSGVLGHMAGEEGAAAVRQIREKGYVVFERALPPDECKRLMEFALTTPSVVCNMDGEAPLATPKKAIFDGVHPHAVRYEFLTDELLANPDIQNLLGDQSLLALAEMYLEARPRADVLSMWWHTGFHGKPDSEAAQYYHFDFDRPKWLKVFIYLTDVGPLDGPHTFIEGSHATGGIPQKFLDRGYARLMDDEVLDHYGESREIKFMAPRGTIIVEDTRGLHKGHPVTGNSRLVLQMQWSNSLFGAAYPKIGFPEERTPKLSEMIRCNGDVYSAYLR